MVPSSRVSSMELYSQEDENLVLRNKEKIQWLAGGLLENLFYKLYDEADREVPLSAEIASKIKVCLSYIMQCPPAVFTIPCPIVWFWYMVMNKPDIKESLCVSLTLTVFKVNWTGDVKMKDLVEGKLPDILVPTQVQEERFYQVSFQDQSVSVSFNIV